MLLVRRLVHGGARTHQNAAMFIACSAVLVHRSDPFNFEIWRSKELEGDHGRCHSCQVVCNGPTSPSAEGRNGRASGQAGFRKDYRTTDQIFIINTLLQQARHQPRKLYCCFVEFKKAFDLVPRHTLWEVLEKRGMKGRVLSSLQSMYAADKAYVLTSEGSTAAFPCGIGVKQGCPASPLLFGLYLDELEELLEDAADSIDCPCLASLILTIMLFADDIALFSHSPSGLQTQLDILAAFCAERGLAVNVKKTKTTVFQHANCSPDVQTFFYAGDPIEQVMEFRYLGALMHASKPLSPAIEYRHKAARRAMCLGSSAAASIYI